MLLAATTESLELETSAAVSVDWSVYWADHTTTTFTPGAGQGNVATATTTTIVASPAASTQRQIKKISVRNRSSTAAQTVTLKKDVSGTEYHETPPITLQPGETLVYLDGAGYTVLNAQGGAKVSQAQLPSAYAYAVPIYKVRSAAAEAVGVDNSLHAETGFPGAWDPGTPGINGRATDGTAAADGGCLPIPNAASGYNYLVGWQAQSTVVHSHYLHDVLWVNSGIAVTTTTNQAITSVAWPARDINGSTNGAGLMVGILVTTATTNAGAITNTTLSYTNEVGTAGRTATMASFPATAVAGTLVWFQLAAGDMGIRSIQGITLGTSYGGGAISLIVARRLAQATPTVVNVTADAAPLRPSEQGGAGIRLYSGSCVLAAYRATATGATTLSGLATIEVR